MCIWELTLRPPCVPVRTLVADYGACNAAMIVLGTFATIVCVVVLGFYAASVWMTLRLYQVFGATDPDGCAFCVDDWSYYEHVCRGI